MRRADAYSRSRDAQSRSRVRGSTSRAWPHRPRRLPANPAAPALGSLRRRLRAGIWRDPTALRPDRRDGIGGISGMGGLRAIDTSILGSRRYNGHARLRECGDRQFRLGGFARATFARPPLAGLLSQRTIIIANCLVPAALRNRVGEVECDTSAARQHVHLRSLSERLRELKAIARRAASIPASKAGKLFKVVADEAGDASADAGDTLSPARLRAWAKRRTASASSGMGTSTSTRIIPAVARCRLTRAVVALLFPETLISAVMFPETMVVNVSGKHSIWWPE